MPILDELDARLKAAMKARDQATLDTLRMIRSRIMERRNEPDFKGEVTDAIVIEIIGAYVKQQKKAIPEFEKAGAAGAEMIARLEAEIAYLTPFLPSVLSEAATEELVRATLADLGVSDPSRAGQVMGTIMKSHKGQVDAALVRRLVDAALST